MTTHSRSFGFPVQIENVVRALPDNLDVVRDGPRLILHHELGLQVFSLVITRWQGEEAPFITSPAWKATALLAADDHPAWRRLDDISATLWKYPDPQKAFLGNGSLYWKAPVLLGEVGEFPLGLIQLISKFPRAEIMADRVDRAGHFLVFRFNGGYGHIQTIRPRDLPKAVFRIFQPRRDPLTQAPIWEKDMPPSAEIQQARQASLPPSMRYVAPPDPDTEITRED